MEKTIGYIILVILALGLLIPHAIWLVRLKIRNNSLYKFAQEFGLNFVSKIKSIFLPLGLKETKINEISGLYKNHQILIYDTYHTIFFSIYWYEMKETYILVDGKRVTGHFLLGGNTAFLAPMTEIRKFLNNLS